MEFEEQGGAVRNAALEIIKENGRGLLTFRTREVNMSLILFSLTFDRCQDRSRPQRGQKGEKDIRIVSTPSSKGNNYDTISLNLGSCLKEFPGNGVGGWF